MTDDDDASRNLFGCKYMASRLIIFRTLGLFHRDSSNLVNPMSCDIVLPVKSSDAE